MKNKELERLDKKIDQALEGLSAKDRKKFLNEALRAFEEKLKAAKKASGGATLRSKIIRLAHANPKLREHLLPLVKEAGGAYGISERYDRHSGDTTWTVSDQVPSPKQAQFPSHVYGNVRAEKLARDFVRRLSQSGDWDREYWKLPRK